ncbi:hypothetical protein B9Z19DRAFT_1118252 [Tuber borchii]|uniref:Uncharacterized protein n=1 Tax=Tuber borchii TaxID=42251 RepID=A0A2T7A8W2_TUBBO|nr:hypothetical protein B9Z19DRAFT_1118252 [Tuber borchii]
MHAKPLVRTCVGVQFQHYTKDVFRFEAFQEVVGPKSEEPVISCVADGNYFSISITPSTPPRHTRRHPGKRAPPPPLSWSFPPPLDQKPGNSPLNMRVRESRQQQLHLVLLTLREQQPLLPKNTAPAIGYQRRLDEAAALCVQHFSQCLWYFWEHSLDAKDPQIMAKLPRGKAGAGGWEASAWGKGLITEDEAIVEFAGVAGEEYRGCGDPVKMLIKDQIESEGQTGGVHRRPTLVDNR